MSPLNIQRDMAAVQAISAVPRILRSIAEITGMRFTCIARVTEDAWTICAVYDGAGFGLVPGNELPIDTTFCQTVRATRVPVVFDSAAASDVYSYHPSPKLYGFDSYASLPLYRSNGDFFGTLCALDPLPATPSDPSTLATLRLFAELISDQLFSEEQLQHTKGLHESVSEQLRTTVQAHTEIEHALIQLRESEDRFRAAVAATGVMWTNDAEGKMTGEQPGWSDLTGQSREEYEGYGWAQAIHPEDAAPTVAAWEAAVRERRTFEFEHRIIQKDGDWRTFAVKAVPVFSEQGIVREWVGVHTDITDRKRSEDALATKEARIRLATDVIGLGIWTWDPIHDVVSWENQRICEIFGVEEGTVPINAERFAGQFLHPEDLPAFELAVAGASSGSSQLNFQGRIYRADNKALRWIELNGERYEIRRGVHGILGTVIDVTDRKKGEQALRSLADELTHADKRKSEFIATLAHELRNPLAPIKNGAQLLRMSSASPATVARVSEVIERQIGQMVHLIDDLLDVARISRGQIELRRELIDLKQIAAMAVESSLPVLEARNHDFSVDVGTAPIIVLVDPTRISQVISNLLTNSAKYSPPNSKIQLATGRDDNWAVVSVRDSGVGIPADELERVFDMFTQVDVHRPDAQGGLGIGLALVRSLVQLHGGTVQAYSAGAGSGSTFVVHLPLADQNELQGEI